MVQEFDFAFLDWLQQNVRCGWLDWLMPKVTSLGYAAVLWVCIALILVTRQSRRRLGVKIAVGLILGAIISSILLKNIVARPRPCWINTTIDMLINIPRDYSFPSGHTLAGFSSAITIARSHKHAGICAFVVAVLIAFSRMYLYVHFLTDVLAGAVIGIVVGLIACWLVDKKWPDEKVLES